jgi:uncharacterized protein YdhG (YjbR/CyaY superfamily)
MPSKKYHSIEEYHASFPPATQALLVQLNEIIKQVAPTATALISYNMPAFKLNKVLVYYAAYAHHIGFYPTAKPIAIFKKELSSYKTSKGAIQFPLTEKIPVALIKKIVRFRIKEVGG